MDGGSHCIGGCDQNHPQEEETQKRQNGYLKRRERQRRKEEKEKAKEKSSKE